MAEQIFQIFSHPTYTGLSLNGECVPAVTTCGAVTVGAPQLPGAYTLSMTEESGHVGDEVRVLVQLDVENSGATGWSFGVCHDDALAAVVGIEQGVDLVSLAPEFYTTAVYDSGWTTSVVIEVGNPAA